MNTQASAATAAFLEPHQPPDLAPQPLGCGLQPAKKASVSAPLSRRENFMLTSYTMRRRRFVWFLPRAPQPSPPGPRRGIVRIRSGEVTAETDAVTT